MNEQAVIAMMEAAHVEAHEARRIIKELRNRGFRVWQQRLDREDDEAWLARQKPLRQYAPPAPLIDGEDAGDG